MTWYVMMRSWVRGMRGLCSRCNSDAPEMDTCYVCNGYHGIPSPAQAARWVSAYFVGEDETKPRNYLGRVKQ